MDVNRKTGGRTSFASTSIQGLFDRGANVPKCVEDTFKRAINACDNDRYTCAGKGKYPPTKERRCDWRGGCYTYTPHSFHDSCTSTVAKDWDYRDQCIANYMSVRPSGFSFDPEAIPGPEPKYPKGPWSDEGARLVGSGKSAFLTADCKVVDLMSIPPVSQICFAGTVFWIGSPISLILDEDHDKSEKWTLNSFPLNPNSENGTVNVWKASGKRPLLVFDPEHKGIITTGEQLFGNWTWGGKEKIPAPYLENSKHISKESSRWKDGYEVLSLFDLDGDEIVSDDELKDLALWYDYNQDGISDQGEVKLLKEVGVKELYFKVDEDQPVMHEIRASKGFKIARNGSEEIKSSVDWFGILGTDYSELITSQLLANKAFRNIKELNSLEARSSGNKNKSKNASAAGSLAGSISGPWSWVGKDKISGESMTGGHFYFNDSGNGSVIGHSYSQATFKEHQGDAAMAIAALQLYGKRVVGQNGENKLMFQIQLEDGTILSSEASILDNETKMNGETTVQTSWKEKPITISYFWVAEKMK